MPVGVKRIGTVLTYLNETAESFTPRTESKLTQSSFLSGRIPSLHEVPVRPIADYFQGHAPIWHDILTRRIPLTSSYAKLTDQIDGGRNVLISGIPVSGKSTLLMQAAAYHDTHKVKLFEDTITPEKVRSIVNKVQGNGEVLLFIDNVGDSVDALDILSGRSDVQIVAADRSVNISFGSHRFDRRRFVTLDFSDPNQSDYAKIFEAIPPTLRKSRMVVPIVSGLYPPSTFEFIEGNVQRQSTAERYSDVLSKLLHRQKDTHDLFVMICYVFSCHAPVSFDVVSHFIGASGDYLKVYAAVEKLGKLLGEIDSSDREFTDLNDSQDYFTPRSTLVAETVVERCRNEDFCRIYLRFHKSVPRLFIPRFSTFRRYGFRYWLVARVFPNWEDVRSFTFRRTGRTTATSSSSSSQSTWEFERNMRWRSNILTKHCQNRGISNQVFGTHMPDYFLMRI